MGTTLSFTAAQLATKLFHISSPWAADWDDVSAKSTSTRFWTAAKQQQSQRRKHQQSLQQWPKWWHIQMLKYIYTVSHYFFFFPFIVNLKDELQTESLQNTFKALIPSQCVSAGRSGHLSNHWPLTPLIAECNSINRVGRLERLPVPCDLLERFRWKW